LYGYYIEGEIRILCQVGEDELRTKLKTRNDD